MRKWLDAVWEATVFQVSWNEDLKRVTCHLQTFLNKMMYDNPSKPWLLLIFQLNYENAHFNIEAFVYVMKLIQSGRSFRVFYLRSYLMRASRNGVRKGLTTPIYNISTNKTWISIKCKYIFLRLYNSND